MISKLVILFFVLAPTLSGCGPEPLTDCVKGLCGQKWAQELDSAIAQCEAHLKIHPDEPRGLLRLAEAYYQKASFIKNQTYSREDFVLSSNLKKIDRLLDEALRASDEALLQKQDSAEVFDFKGRVCFLRGELRGAGEWRRGFDFWRKSISYHEKAVSLRPNAAEMWYNLGVSREIFFWREKPQECYEKAIELDPTFAKGYAALARYPKYRSKGYSLKAFQFGSGDPEVLRTVAGSYISDELKDAYIKSIRSIPNVAKAPLVLGLSSLLPKYGERESRILKEIVRMDHHFFKDHQSLGAYSLQKGILSTSSGRSKSFEKASLNDALRHVKIWAEAMGSVGRATGYLSGDEICAELIQMYPATPWVYVYTGMNRQDLQAPYGRSAVGIDSAVQCFKKAIRLDSSFAMAYYLLAAKYVEKEDWVSGERWLKETLRRAPNDEFVTLNAHLLSTLVRARRGDISQAIHECDLALRMDSAYVKSALRWGIYGRGYLRDLLFRLDEPIGAESVRTASDRKIASLLNLSSGWGYWSRKSSGGEYNRFFQKAIDLDPGNLDAYFALATMRSFENEYDKGIELVRKVIRLHPDNATAHKHLGHLYLEKNLLDKAKQELELAYKLGDFEARITLDMVEESRKEKHLQ